jgi:hypothetical protein
MRQILFVITTLALLSLIILPATASAQPTPTPIPQPKISKLIIDQGENRDPLSAWCLDVNEDLRCDYILFQNGTVIATSPPLISMAVPSPIYNFYKNYEIIKRIDTTSSMPSNNDDDDDDDDEDLEDICFFDPADERCSPDENGNCPEGWPRNEDGQCHPGGQCPDGFHRANDDESGRCVPEDDLQQCEDGSWAHEDDTCPEDAEPFPTPTPEPITCEEGFVLENGRCAALDSNCGGEPCTASQKEDSTVSDVTPGDSEPTPQPQPQPEPEPEEEEEGEDGNEVNG